MAITARRIKASFPSMSCAPSSHTVSHSKHTSSSERIQKCVNPLKAACAAQAPQSPQRTENHRAARLWARLTGGSWTTRHTSHEKNSLLAPRDAQKSTRGALPLFSPLCPTYSPVDSAFRGGEGASVRDATKFPPTEHEFPAPSREAAGQSQGRDSLLTEDHSGQRHL